jgi:hypothetical protein
MKVTREVTLNDVDARTGELVWKTGEANESFKEHLIASQAWEDLSARFDLSDADNLLVVNAYLQSIPTPLILSKAESGLRKLLYAGGQCKFGSLTLKPVEQLPDPVLVEPAKDSRGHLLGASQRQWQEYREYSENHSSQDCKNRARVDSRYASFVRLNLEREAQGTPSTQFQIAGQQPVKPTVQADAEYQRLVDFADEVKRTPTRIVKTKMLPTNPRFESYTADVNECIRLGLI